MREEILRRTAQLMNLSPDRATEIMFLSGDDEYGTFMSIHPPFEATRTRLVRDRAYGIEFASFEAFLTALDTVED